MPSRSEHPRSGRPGQPRRPPVAVRGIPQGLLVACASFGPELPAARVAAAIGRGLQAGGRPELDLCPLEPHPLAAEDLRELLKALDFDARMRRARAVIVAEQDLAARALSGAALIASITFEIATRARQGGVPAYAVGGAGRLDAFDARMLDLQIVIEAPSARTLTAAGRKLAGLV